MEPSQADSLQKSVMIGPYRVIAQLARGGMGVIYLAVTHGPGGFSKILVVKELKASLAEEEEFVLMFLREARLAARLNHPNVVQTLDVRSEGDRHLIAMEFIDGQSLDRIMRRTQKLEVEVPVEVLLHVIVQLLEALHYIHAVPDLDGNHMNLIHRDVSPQNVLVAYDGQVKILDFGIAKADDGGDKTSVGVLKGKARWMAPEQARFAQLDGRSDLFAVGALLWEAIVGKPLWPATFKENDILVALARGDMPNPRELKPDLDPRAESLLARALAPEPKNRFKDAEEMQVAVQGYLDSLNQPGVTSRRVGKVVADLFAEERTQVNGIIEQILRDVAAGIAVEPVKLPFGAQRQYSDADISLRTDSSSLSIRSDESGAGRSRRPVTTSTSPTDEPPPRRAALRYVGGGLVVAAIAAAGIVVSQRGTPPAAPVNAAQAPVETAAAPRSVHVVVNVRPNEASVSLDDGPKQEGAYASLLPADTATHVLKIEAPHYKPQTMRFSGDADHTFDVSLEPAPTATAAAPVVTATPRGNVRIAPPVMGTLATGVPVVGASPSSPPTVPPPATATGRKKQPIEKNDPYGNAP